MRPSMGVSFPTVNEKDETQQTPHGSMRPFPKPWHDKTEKQIPEHLRASKDRRHIPAKYTPTNTSHGYVEFTS